MLSSPITAIKGIGPRRAEAFGRLGLFALKDLIYFFPKGYVDYSRAKLIKEVENGETAAIKVNVLAPAKNVRIRGGLTMTTVGANDGLSKLQLVWFNQPYSASKLNVGDSIYACGRVDKRHGLKLMNPVLYDELPGIVPIYRQCSGLSQKIIRETISAALEICLNTIDETLCEEMLEKYALIPQRTALLAVHKPTDQQSLNKAKDRLAFDDMLLYCAMVAIIKRGRQNRQGIAFNTAGLTEQYLGLLPFAPTKAQLAVMEDIAFDMAQKKQMNRLVQGDVGSGKTACALFAMFIAIKNGHSAAMVAPTEILAEQHHKKLIKLFGEENVVLIKGSMKKKDRADALKKLAQGKPVAIAATHALISEGVDIPNLGIVVADEQHRFGVRQRALMAAKGKGGVPDMLIMSATPIPRTLSLLMYGDLDLSVINMLPPGRKPVITRIVPAEKRQDMYNFVQAQLKGGLQAYAVCPMIDESEAMDGVLSASSLYEELSGKLEIKTELMHGKLKPADKTAIAERFLLGETQLLVSTTVIEVGVDVPNAAIMVIENADRFGLAQLHQLRGRVGRGSAASYCFLLSERESQSAKERLKVLCETSDGFEIAEKDLLIRGPGEMLGQRQHGEDVFGAARFAGNMRVFELAKQASSELLEQNDNTNPILQRAMALAQDKNKTVSQN